MNLTDSEAWKSASTAVLEKCVTYNILAKTGKYGDFELDKTIKPVIQELIVQPIYRKLIHLENKYKDPDDTHIRGLLHNVVLIPASITEEIRNAYGIKKTMLEYEQEAKKIKANYDATMKDYEARRKIAHESLMKIHQIFLETKPSLVANLSPGIEYLLTPARCKMLNSEYVLLAKKLKDAVETKEEIARGLEIVAEINKIRTSSRFLEYNADELADQRALFETYNLYAKETYDIYLEVAECLRLLKNEMIFIGDGIPITPA